MILIADSGSTKTDWGVTQSQGINPFHQSPEAIRQILRSEVLPSLPADEISSVYFYGSGVRPEMESLMVSLLHEVFPLAFTVEAHSDLLGAARALCGHNYGIASILGTGANSCLYDGERIVQNTPALGYILGDEGSGAVLGKRFLRSLYMGLLSKEIVSIFEDETGLTLPKVINRVYRQPLANRFLASLSEFICRHKSHPGIHQLVVDNFSDFFRLHIAPYNHPELPVSFVGSVAWYYQDELQEAAIREGFTVGVVLQTPMPGLQRYHNQNS